MAARWTRRRLTLVFLICGVVAFVYFQSDKYVTLSPSWDSILQPETPASLVSPGGTASEKATANEVADPETAFMPAVPNDSKFHWSQVKLHNPIARDAMRPVPKASTEMLAGIPAIQHPFKEPETAEARTVRLVRLELVRANFTHAWNGYKKYAWMADEVRPVKGAKVSKFGGWAATLVDTLGRSSCLGRACAQLTACRYALDHGHAGRV